MQRNTKRRTYLLLILAAVLVAVVAVLGRSAILRLEGHITRSGEANMYAVMEQMAQVYDLQVSHVYEKLQNIENTLFSGSERSLQMVENKNVSNGSFRAVSEQILFVKDSGQVMTSDGTEHYIDVQSSTLLKLRQNERIAQSITWSDDTRKEICYLVALPCKTYYVNGEKFSAIGLLYSRSSFDVLLDVNGYGGRAVMFSVDENGIVIYTNQADEKYDRNYSLLKHLKAEKMITGEQYDRLKQELGAKARGVELIENGTDPYYFGYCPLDSGQSELVCIVPASAVNSSLLEYQNLAMQMIIAVLIVFVLLCAALMVVISRAVSATQKARYEEKTRLIREEAMVALEAEKDRADCANNAKSRFLSNMSHDIRTPMNAIIGFTSLAETHLDNRELLKDYLRKISASSEHLLSLINDVLDMSRIESGKMKINETECSIPAIARDLRNILLPSINAKQLDFFIDAVDVEHEDVICDKLRVNRVLINIASNAIKYTHPGGTISVRITEKPNAPEGCADFEFSVKDTGIGMSKEFIKTIFEPFTRERSTTVSRIEGTGLGMTITKNIVDMMGGTITVQSEPGKGSEFTVKLRFGTSRSRNEITVIPELKGCRALVAGNSMDSCGSVMKLLHAVGMCPECTVCGEDAVIRAKTAADENDPFGVYIVDRLVSDMDGVEVVRKLRENIGEETPIIILTSCERNDIGDEARAAGVTAFCTKPLFKSELYEILRNRQSVGADEVTEEPAAEQFRGRRVLLADDVELNRVIAVALLEEAGVAVETADNGKDAVDMVAGSKPGYYDIVLMDIMMPVMDGYEATGAIRSLDDPKLAEIPIIAMTANAFEEDRQAALKAGMDDHLAKPIQTEQLFEMMRKYSLK